MNATEQTIPPANVLTISEMQKASDEIYRDENSTDFELTDMLGRLDEYGSRICLWVRKEEAERIDYHLCMVLSWLFAITNRLLPIRTHGDIRKHLAKHCGLELSPAAPLSEIQAEFARRHEGVSREGAVLCLAEKLLALSSAIGKYRAAHEIEHRELSARRIAQSVEALLVVSSVFSVSMSETYHRYFANGCPKCTEKICGCEFRLDAVK